MGALKPFEENRVKLVFIIPATVIYNGWKTRVILTSPPRWIQLMDAVNGKGTKQMSNELGQTEGLDVRCNL